MSFEDNPADDDPHGECRHEIQQLQAENKRLRELLGAADIALTLVVKWAEFTRDHWDNGLDHKVGKCLTALAGESPGYAPDTDAIHAYHKQIQEYRREQA